MKPFQFKKCSLLAIVLLSIVPVSKASNNTSTEISGHSIFHETMVDMTWQEVEQAAQEDAIILFPTAVIEEHGPHMANGVDTYLGYINCVLVKRELDSRGIKTLIAPPFYWVINKTTHVFPGTFTVRETTMKALIYDTINSLKSWGFTEIYNINWHNDGTHRITILQAIVDACRRQNVNAYCLLPEYDLGRFQLTGEEDFIVAHKEPPSDDSPSEYLSLHAEEFETGAMAAFFLNSSM